MLESLINQVLVVSLQDDLNRREHIKSHFADLELTDYRFVDAVSHTSEQVSRAYFQGLVKTYPECFRCNQTSCKCENNVLIPQQVANWLSFRKTWEQVASSEGWSLVCEDDVFFYPGGLQKLTHFLVDRLPLLNEKPALFRLGHSGLPTDVLLGEEVELEDSRDIVMSNVAHIMNAEFAKLLMRSFSRIETTSDIWVHQIVASMDDVTSVTCSPLIATDLSFNKEFAKFQSRIHPKGIDEEDKLRAHSHQKKVCSSKEYLGLLNAWFGSFRDVGDILVQSAFKELEQKQSLLIKQYSPKQPKRDYTGQLDRAIDNEYGFINSFENWESVDKQGNPIPWMTYSAIYYLKSLSLEHASIFEWGSGNSSRFFARNGKSVVSIESNKDWYEYVRSEKLANQEVLLKKPDQYCCCIIDFEQLFDVIVIDGDIYRRLECASFACNKLAPGGIIVLDNSDWLPHTAEYLRGQGYTQIDFSGPGPINNYLWCTSIFFKGFISLSRKEDLVPGCLSTGLKNQRDCEIDTFTRGNKISQDDFKRAFLSENYNLLKDNFLPREVDIFSAQEGEDILLKRLLKGYYYNPGFYVDVGAHDPIRFSNTYHYYLNGWRGINIDPRPGMKESFMQMRARDVNLEIGISQNEGLLTYYQFEEPAFNTFDVESVDYAKTRTRLKSLITIPVVPLSKVFDEHMPLDESLIFINIDVEGLELQVLKSNDWEQYRPKVVIVEALTKAALIEIEEYLSKNGYIWVASTKNSHFFCEIAFWDEVR